jgi:hypothetical protein
MANINDELAKHEAQMFNAVKNLIEIGGELGSELFKLAFEEALEVIKQEEELNKEESK